MRDYIKQAVLYLGAASFAMGACMMHSDYDCRIIAENISESETADINGDGFMNAADVVILQNYLLGVETEIKADITEADLSGDGRINIADLCMLKNRILYDRIITSVINVSSTEELKVALENAVPGDNIILAEGDYYYSGTTPKGFMFRSECDGTEDAPITLRSENPDKPAVLHGMKPESGTVLRISGDWWNICNIRVTGGQKGIVLDNSCHSIISGCEVYGTGSEGIHLRDDSSSCVVSDCYVHDTGTVSPGYGEAVYIGSAKNTTGYGFDCSYNTVRSCRLGPNVAAEHVDVKEYTTGTVIENCIFDGKGMSGENSSKSFVNIKGNGCILRNNTGYRNGCDKILRAFEQNMVADGWGQDALVYGNRVYMDVSVGVTGKKMYFLNSWDCTVTVHDNFMAYEDGILFSVDDEKDYRKYYNCNLLTFKEQD